MIIQMRSNVLLSKVLLLPPTPTMRSVLSSQRARKSGRLAKGQPAKKEWWFCGAQCKKLYESDKFDHSKLAGREKEIERRYGSTNRRQKLCLLCMHTNDTHRAKGRDGDDIDVESSDEHGRTGPKLREAAIMAVLRKGVTDLKV